MRLRSLAAALLALTACSSSPAGRHEPDGPGADEVGPPRHLAAPAGAIVFEDVTVLPMDREGVLEHQSVVVDKDRIVLVAPAARVDVPASATRIDGRGKFLLPGLADMHVHALDDEDLFLYLAAGVTQLRATYAPPHVMAQRERVATGAVLGPTIHIEGQIVDGAKPVWNWSMAVASEADIDKVIAFHLENKLPAIKVYERLTRGQYDSLIAKAKKSGLRIVGHVPEAVGLAHALESGQSSIEHLDGYSVYLTPDGTYGKDRRFWQTDPIEWAGFVASFGQIDDKRLDQVAAMTRKAGTWNCPTLVLYDHYLRSDDPKVRAGFRGAAYLAPYKKSHWDPASFPLVRTPSHYDFEAMRRARPKLLALVRALDAASAGLLVGTDSGNANIVPGYSALDEIELFVEAGVTPWRAIRAATSGAAAFLGQSKEWGQVAAGRRADLLLLRASPLEDIKNIALRDGVMVRGRWMPAADLDARLATMVEYNTGKRSRLAELPPPPVEGKRELVARYTIRHGDEYGGEQRLVIDRRADGSRVIKAVIMTGEASERVMVEVGDGRGSLLRRESQRGVLELRRSKNKLHATFTPAGGAPAMTATFELPASAYLSAVTLAPDQLFYPAAMKLRPGGQVTIQVVLVYSGSKLTMERSIFRFLRRPDRKDAPRARVFSLAITVRNQTFKGELVLDGDGRLREQTMFGETTTATAVGTGNGVSGSEFH